jgi:hypothetical protein
MIHKLEVSVTEVKKLKTGGLSNFSRVTQEGYKSNLLTPSPILSLRSVFVKWSASVSDVYCLPIAMWVAQEQLFSMWSRL